MQDISERSAALRTREAGISGRESAAQASEEQARLLNKDTQEKLEAVTRVRNQVLRQETHAELSSLLNHLEISATSRQRRIIIH